MNNEYVTVANEDTGLFEDIHINDTFFVKDIILNKTWDDMDNYERTDALLKIHAVSPRYLAKSFKELPSELQNALLKIKGVANQDNDGNIPNEVQDNKIAEGIKKNNGAEESQKEDDDMNKDFRTTKQKGDADDLWKSWLQNRNLSDVDVSTHGNIGGRPHVGVSTNESRTVDAEEDYEGQTHSGVRPEQFKHEKKKPQVDEILHGKKKESISTSGDGGSPVKTSDSGFVNSVYNTKQHNEDKKGRASNHKRDKDDERNS